MVVRSPVGIIIDNEQYTDLRVSRSRRIMCPSCRAEPPRSCIRLPGESMEDVPREWVHLTRETAYLESVKGA